MGKRVVIVGAGAAGGSVTAEAQRGDPSLEVILIEQRSQVSVAA
jgi:NADH dehydrogenase FAD-containing subunit